MTVVYKVFAFMLHKNKTAATGWNYDSSNLPDKKTQQPVLSFSFQSMTVLATRSKTEKDIHATSPSFFQAVRMKRSPQSYQDLSVWFVWVCWGFSVSVLILLLLLFDFIILTWSGPKHQSTAEEIFLLSSEGTGNLEILALLSIQSIFWHVS